MTTFEKLSKYVDENQKFYIERLAEVVAIPSVSGEAARRPEVHRMGQWLVSELKRLGASVNIHNPGKQTLEGKELELPPIVLGQYGSDPNKKTVLVYGHYDVQPAFKEDGWATDPWTLVEDEKGRLIGRGSTDDKAPVISWLWVIEAHQKLGLEMPVNLKMCFEGMEESGSEGLDEFIYKEAKGEFFGDVDCVCISDNCKEFHLVQVTVIRVKYLFHVMSKLVSPNGKILVPGIYDDVAPVTEAEDKLYDSLDFNLSDIQNAMDSKVTIFNTEKETLMARWRFPSLSLHGIEGAFYSPGAKTVIPAKVIGKFSIRSVPNMDPAKITELVEKYIKEEFEKLGSKNTIKVECGHAGKAWVADPNHWNFVAANKAIENVFKVKPDLTREGGSIPVTLTFQEALDKNVLLLPMGRADDGAHSINEKIDKTNYIEGIKLLASYLHEIAVVAA
ncbi:metallodipeptidase [Spizellomyces punctatus DAOM BR117]|uniref:Peptidase M20 dimerisation domain-containing protein n=1 Tax=Spizellomyces punctatus (strain DAOM BR117) TaxID=645134 RepID=A0A0L0HCX8_SPIPD|nr:metallodipeptidase [Spizellomyces punctatus DAOM BR117]KNC98799.1 hypothetical protein SPPG_09306 [Spizellomyces punctatus DAOM BR117]|eukprot:XP_016606839.1 hypothetical protein SPPG_09306 [Spizellomyces punctatus DAOM BR117]